MNTKYLTTFYLFYIKEDLTIKSCTVEKLTKVVIDSTTTPQLDVRTSNCGQINENKNLDVLKQKIGTSKRD